MTSSAATISDQPSTAAPSSRGMIPLNLQLSLSDQLYRQAKIDEENQRLKKKSSKGEGGSSKKGKKSSKKSDAAAAEENDEDLYPMIKVTRGGELPEGVTESGNEDNDQDETARKTKKLDPHRALNIDLEDKPVPKTSTPPVPVQEPPLPPPSKPTENPAATTKKPKKKKTTEKEGKSKRERGDYKELLSPMEEIDKPILPPATTSAPVSTKSEEKPKKKKTATKKTKEAKSSDAFLFDMMSDDIQSTASSTQQYNEQTAYKPVAQSDDLIIVRTIQTRSSSFHSVHLISSRNLRSFQVHLLLN